MGLIVGVALAARAAPTWIVYDRNGEDIGAYVGDASDCLAVLFTPPSSPMQILAVRINTTRFMGAPLEDHRYRIVDAALATEHLEATVTDGGAGWQELDVEPDDIVVSGDFYVQ